MPDRKAAAHEESGRADVMMLLVKICYDTQRLKETKWRSIGRKVCLWCLAAKSSFCCQIVEDYPSNRYMSRMIKSHAAGPFHSSQFLQSIIFHSSSFHSHGIPAARADSSIGILQDSLAKVL